MPYKNRLGNIEKARSIGHVPLVQNPVIQERLKEFRLFTSQPDKAIESRLLIAANTLGKPGEPIHWAMSFDGSPQEVAAREEHPSTRVGYIQIAGVLVHLEEMLGQQAHHLVDPLVIKKSSQEALHSMVLPGSNVCRQDMPTVRDSWRAEIYDIFKNYSIEDLPLLDIFMELVNHSDKKGPSGTVVLGRCSATESCESKNISVPKEGASCPTCKGRLFPTDTLRVHEEVLEEHSNATALGRLMGALEQITMIGYLHFLWHRQPRVLGAVGFILDGPLALFGPQAWLHTAILSFIHSVVDNLTKQNLTPPIILGLEKTGQFAEHGEAIRGKIPPRHLMILPDDYIFSHILTFRPSGSSAFGRDTYYGQKFFYKTAQNQLLTVTIPKPKGMPADPHSPAHYPSLPSTLALLDRIGTTLYDDAVIPVALAHSFASIPLRTGSKVLTLLSRELLGLK